MRKQLISLGAVTMVVALLATPALAASRGASFTPIGLFPTCDQVPEGEFCENFPLTTVTDISGDGSVVVGLHAFYGGTYVWTAEDGLQTIGPSSGTAEIADVSGDVFYNPGYDWNNSGTLVAWGSYWTGGYWPNETWVPLPAAPDFDTCGSSAQSGYDTNADGTLAVGLTWVDLDMDGSTCDGARAFSSTGGVTTVLDSSVNNDSTRANAVNADGSVIVGWMQTNSREASKWVNGVQSFLCPNPSGLGGDNFCNEGWDVTPDGNLMLTSLATPNDFSTRATIVDQNGNVNQLPFPDAPYDPFWDTFQGWAISDDGKTVVGEFGGGGFFGSPPYPVLWNEDIGMTLDLQVFLLGQGLDDLFFWFLSSASAVNSDGTIIAGQGTNPDGWIEGYVVDISKVKVCHKPDGNGQGNERTIAIAWGSVPDHLAHGDILATCEFAAADGHSRAMATRTAMVSANQDPNYDERIGTIEELNRMRERIGQSSPFGTFGAVANPYPTTDNGESAVGGQSPAQRESVRQRVERTRQR